MQHSLQIELHLRYKNWRRQRIHHLFSNKYSSNFMLKIQTLHSTSMHQLNILSRQAVYCIEAKHTLFNIKRKLNYLLTFDVYLSNQTINDISI